jgi:hypothetical protein
MKLREFRKLIREEVRRVLSERAFKAGQEAVNLNDDPVKVLKVYPNKKAALMDLKATLPASKFKQIFDEVQEYYDNYRPIDKRDDMKPWYYVEDMQDPKIKTLEPHAYLEPLED